jgi:small subunit ribosomal protein S6
MKIYELMVILDGSLDEDKYKAALAQVEKIIKSKGGTVTAVDEWGKRRLAYTIRHQDFGYYIVCRLTAEKAEVPADIQAILKIQDIVLRAMMTIAKAKRAVPSTDEAIDKPVKRVTETTAKE